MKRREINTYTCFGYKKMRLTKSIDRKLEEFWGNWVQKVYIKFLAFWIPKITCYKLKWKRKKNNQKTGSNHNATKNVKYVSTSSSG